MNIFVYNYNGIEMAGDMYSLNTTLCWVLNLFKSGILIGILKLIVGMHTTIDFWSEPTLMIPTLSFVPLFISIYCTKGC